MDDRNLEMIAHRYSNFAWVTVFVAVLILGIWFGFNVRAQMSSTTFYIWIGMCGFLLFFGVITWVYYLYLIFKNFR